MLANWTTNNKMKKILKAIPSNQNVEKIEIDMQQFNRLLCPSFQKVRDCIIITEKDVNKIEKNFSNVIKMYMDKTGYEASNTETRINYYFQNEISIVTGIQIALMVIEIWALRLKQMEPNSAFCFIVFSNEEYVEIRFHKVRNDERRWLDEDLEKYEDEAVGYVII